MSFQISQQLFDISVEHLRQFVAIPSVSNPNSPDHKMECILPGVEDPHSAAHSFNESQDIKLLRNSINTFISFLDKCGKV